jgi:hypothetical protein
VGSLDAIIGAPSMKLRTRSARLNAACTVALSARHRSKMAPRSMSEDNDLEPGDVNACGCASLLNIKVGMWAMDTEKIKTEIRFAAIEYLIANLYAKLFKLAGAPKDLVVAANAEALRNVDAKTFPGLSPVWSDVVAQELADNLGRVMKMIEEMMGTGTSGRDAVR